VCGYEIHQPVAGKAFMPLKVCPSEPCKANQTRGRLHLTLAKSKWVKYQELTVQELPEHVPTGDIPRTMTVTCTGALTRQVKPGEEVVLGGIFTPTPFTEGT
jgi:DNA replication licensing factor MCM7